MTVVGFSISGTVGLVWADTESYWSDNSPVSEDTQKLGISRNGIVCAGCGAKSLVDHFVDAVKCAPHSSFRGNVEWLRKGLLETSARRRSEFSERGLRDVYVTSSVCAIFRDGGELRGIVMREVEDFAVRAESAWGSPDFHAAPCSATEVLLTASAQMRILRRHMPLATGRHLEIAKIGPRSIARECVPLVASDSI